MPQSGQSEEAKREGCERERKDLQGKECIRWRRRVLASTCVRAGCGGRGIVAPEEAVVLCGLPVRDQPQCKLKTYIGTLQCSLRSRWRLLAAEFISLKAFTRASPRSLQLREHGVFGNLTRVFYFAVMFLQLTVRWRHRNHAAALQ